MENKQNLTHPILDELVSRYGGRQLDYVSDIWGSEPGLLTPEEALEMHKQLDWSDDGYRVLAAGEPGDAVLLDTDGSTILRIPGDAGA